MQPVLGCKFLRIVHKPLCGFFLQSRMNCDFVPRILSMTHVKLRPYPATSLPPYFLPPPSLRFEGRERPGLGAERHRRRGGGPNL